VAQLRQKAAKRRQKAESAADHAERRALLLKANMLDDMADMEERDHRFEAERQRLGGGTHRTAGEVLPWPVERFQMLWFGGMVIGALYDFDVAVVGDYLEAWIDILLFLIAATLLHYAVRRHGNLARLLLVPFLAVTFVEVFSHSGFTASDLTETSLAITQLALMASAVWLLFTPAARDWYS
jgi:hypothetical protein